MLKNIHLILDEVWCGTGTSGKIFCIDWDNITPDFLFISKTLAAGYGALSAVLTKSKISNQIFRENKQIQYSNTGVHNSGNRSMELKHS